MTETSAIMTRLAAVSIHKDIESGTGRVSRDVDTTGARRVSLSL